HRRPGGRPGRRHGARSILGVRVVSGTGSRVRVELGERGYDVVIGPDYDALSAFVRGRRRVAVVTQTAVDQSCGDALRGALEAAGSTYRVFEMGDSEDA